MAEEVLSPLDVLLQAMREKWREKSVEEAVALAKAAAPYVHAKPASGRAPAASRASGDERLNELFKSPDFGKRFAERDLEQPG